MLGESLTDVEQTLDKSRTNVKQKSDGRRMDVGRTSDGNRTKVRRTSDEQSSAATAAMARGGATLQLLVMQRCDEANKALQLTAMARPVERCSSILWQG
ncbi:unnamed protein product [Sphagnum troendelagicum]|uniref:Uncharacterized protein n=1 Tax=Sphagnum troendelagicum TaxID=128251 RepID=A0ABP0TRJ7_9BRYO